MSRYCVRLPSASLPASPQICGVAIRRTGSATGSTGAMLAGAAVGAHRFPTVARPSGDLAERKTFRCEGDHPVIACASPVIHRRTRGLYSCAGRGSWSGLLRPASGGALVTVTPSSLAVSLVSLASLDVEIASSTRVSTRCSRISSRYSTCPGFRTRWKQSATCAACGALADAVSKGTTAIPTDDLDVGRLGVPVHGQLRGRCRYLPIRQQINDRVPDAMLVEVQRGEAAARHTAVHAGTPSHLRPAFAGRGRPSTRWRGVSDE